MRVATYSWAGRRHVGQLSADGRSIVPLSLGDRALEVGALALVEAMADGGGVPRALARRAKEVVTEQGTSWFEFKIARHDLDSDIATIFAVREALGPSVRIAVDANMALTMEQATQLLEAVAPARLDNFEEPVAGLADMATLRRIRGVPVSTHAR